MKTYVILRRSGWRSPEELQKAAERSAAVGDNEMSDDIRWIRSYVLDQSRIKDLRTGLEVGNTKAVLDGDLDQFLEASLKAGV